MPNNKCSCYDAFSSISGSNGADVNLFFAKLKDIDPKRTNFVKKFESRHVQPCPVAVHQFRTHPGRHIFPEKGVLFFSRACMHLFFLARRYHCLDILCACYRGFALSNYRPAIKQSCEKTSETKINTPHTHPTSLLN